MRKSLLSSNYFLTWILASLTILTAQNVARGQTFQDTTFSNSDWNSVLLQPPSTPGASIVPAPGQDPAGNPTTYSRKTTHTYPTGDIFVAHVYNPSSYSPDTGAIVTLSYSYDLINSSKIPGDVAYSFLVLQNGHYYHSAEDYISNNTWATFAGGPKHTNLTAASFIEVDNKPNNNHPDFSCDGLPIQFGYLTRNHNPNSGTTDTTTSNLDNWKVSIDQTRPCTPQCATITEPSVTCDQGTFTYTFTVTNNTNQQIEWLLFSTPPGATYNISAPPYIHLPTPLPPGGHTTASVSITNASPGDHVCLNVALANKDLISCCTVQTCFDLHCPCLEVLDRSITCRNGVNTFTIGVRNLTGAQIQQIFVVPISPPNLNVTLSPVTMPLAVNGTTTLTGTITGGGAQPGTQVCLRIVPFGGEAQCCSTDPICLTLLDCHHRPSPDPQQKTKGKK